MDDNLLQLLGTFEKLPLSCQTLFLSACVETVAVLMVSRNPGALAEALHQDTNWMEISKFTALVERFLYNPKPGDIAQLAHGRDRMDELESQAEFRGRLALPATIASGLGNCAIEPTAERCRTCFLLAHSLMVGHCEQSPTAHALVDKTLLAHLDIITELLVVHSDPNRPPFVMLRPFWKFGRPPGWPIDDLWVVANALISFAGKLGLGAFAKIFK